MTYSTGIDIVSVPRLMKSVNDNAFLDRLLTDAEKQYIFAKRCPYRHLAGRFAAKEAVMKAIGTGWDKGVGWRDIEIVNEPSGKPRVSLHSKAGALAKDRRIFLTLSYAKDVAVAFAIIT